MATGAARALSRLLGDPLDARSGAFSYVEIVRHEEEGRLPPGAMEQLERFGFPQYLVPTDVGGRLRQLEELFFLSRELVRRNATCALRFGSTYLGASPVWLWGSEEQRRAVADGLLGCEDAAFAVSEREHGSDLRATETTLVAAGDGYLLSGSKWPIGNARRGRFLTVLARHERPGRYSFVLVDKERAAPVCLGPLQPIKTVGLRGHDLSGAWFDGVSLPADAVIGRPGNGLAKMLMAIQLTKVLIGAISLGTIDAVLDIGMLHAQSRRLYGRPVWELPMVRSDLLGAHLDALLAECIAIPIIRAVRTLPSRLSLWSSVVKYSATTLGEAAVAAVGRVLGAQSYLREGLAGGAFQKLARDHAVCSIFEGTTHVSLHSVAAQLGALARSAPSDGSAALRPLFDLSLADSVAWDPREHGLQMSNEGLDEITASWGWASRAALDLAQTRLDVAGRYTLGVLVQRLSARRLDFAERCATTNLEPASAPAAAAAREHCIHHAAAACLLVWIYNEPAARMSSSWLVLCLQRLLSGLGEPEEIDGGFLLTWAEEIGMASASGQRVGLAHLFA